MLKKYLLREINQNLYLSNFFHFYLSILYYIYIRGLNHGTCMAKEQNYNETDIEVVEDVLAVDSYNKQFKVIIHNDNFTTMDFVIEVLMKYFEKDFENAYKIMLYVHKNGKAIAGLYSREIAETKIHQVRLLAAENEFPLELTMEKTS